jgi:two-component system response regulator DesR
MSPILTDSPTPTQPVSVLCVDDNPDVVEAIRLLLTRESEYRWNGSLGSADALVDAARATRPDIILLDVDMPGRDPFAVVQELTTSCPEVRVIIFSGYVRRELVNLAITSGAWGYVAKSDGERAMLLAIDRVAAGEFVMSAEVRSGYAL